MYKVLSRVLRAERAGMRERTRWAKPVRGGFRWGDYGDSMIRTGACQGAAVVTGDLLGATAALFESPDFRGGLL
jgi:hypothetical protein